SDISTASFIGSAGSDYTVTEPKTLYARWNENIYDVNYHMEGGHWKANAYNKATRSYTERLVLPTSDDIEKLIGTDAYEFGGWWTMDGTNDNWGTQVIAIEQNTDNDVDVYARWKSTISFNINGHGTALESIEISGSQDVILSSISEIGWTFGGWYSSETEFTDDNFIGFGGETITFDRPKILYAKWTANTYMVVYDEKGGILPGEVCFIKTYGTAITTDLAEPTKDGYTFAGWYRDDNTFNIPYDKTNDDIYVEEQTTFYMEGRPVYFIYAKWTVNTYTIKYNVNGICSTPSNIQKTYDTNVTLAELSNIPAGYTFDGWYSDVDLADGHRYEGNTDLTTSNNVEVNVYARWKAKITYNPNGHGTAPAAEDVILNNTTTLPSIAEVEGYELDPVDSWYDGSNISESVRIGQVGDAYTVTAPKTLYAKWNAKTYPVTLNRNGGTINEGNITEYTYGVGATLPTNVTKANSVFKGWWTEDGTGDNWGQQVAVIETTATEEKTYYARWAQSYAVTFNLTSGTPHPELANVSNAPDTQNIEEGLVAVRPTVNPSAANVAFDNWYTDNTFTTTFNFNQAITAPTTIYAKWIDASTYEVSFNLTSGIYPTGTITNAPESQFVVSGNTVVAPTIPTTDGYRFVGWYKTYNGSAATPDEQFTAPYNFSSAVSESFTLYAKWELITYTITYNLNNGTWVDGYIASTSWTFATPNLDNLLPTDANITRNHYTFDGWYRTSDYSGAEVTTLAGLHENLTLFAKWILDAGGTVYHTINFLSGGGSGSMNSQRAFEGEDTILDAVTFTRPGYTFSNWSSSDGRTLGNSANIGEVTTDLTLTANWSQNPAPYYPPDNPGGGGGGKGGGGGGG
ncbi:MAG: InlB B-repeat-containing protein, partial [Lachnospiraceae bacterium]|nr:InlB B-repeat-containing protein [Lachnospiraceae bacterium]